MDAVLFFPLDHLKSLVMIVLQKRVSPLSVSWDMSLVGVEGRPGRSMYLWNGVCLGTPDSERLYYNGVEIPEPLGLKLVLFISVTK